jgi:AraC family transcriptional regulator
VYGTVGGLPDWQLRRVCSFMEANLNRNVSMAECSGLIGISNEHFCRAFRRTSNMPPHRWFLLKRMERARRMLSETDASLTSIAQELGYTGQSAFGAAFRKAVGQTPRQYRQQLRAGAMCGSESEQGPLLRADP